MLFRDVTRFVRMSRLPRLSGAFQEEGWWGYASWARGEGRARCYERKARKGRR